MKRVKIESDPVKAEEGAPARGGPPVDEEIRNFKATVHDRCSDRLSMATFKWVQRSHMLHKGTPVIIIDDMSPFKGR